MSFEGFNILAVIPARGGSKGVPGKNLRTLHGKSLIEHVSSMIRELPWIDQTVLSTDDPGIQQHAVSIGLDAPFLRPSELSSDHAKSIDAWIHAWLFSEKHYNKKFDLSVLLEPTSPMRLPSDVRNAVALLITSRANSVATVSKTPGHFTPHKTLEIASSGYLHPYLMNGMKYSIRQEIPSYYHRNGICYAVTRDSLINQHNLMEKNCLPLLIERPVVNIDEEIDLKIAEFLMANT